MVEGVALKTYR